jgi:hypothetical protein
MTTATLTDMTTAQLLQHDRNIGEHLSRPGMFRDGNKARAREWLTARTAVRTELERRHVSASAAEAIAYIDGR